MAPDSHLEAAYEDRFNSDLDDLSEEDFGPDCDPGCYQGSHTETCEWYAWRYEGGE